MIRNFGSQFWSWAVLVGLHFVTTPVTNPIRNMAQALMKEAAHKKGSEWDVLFISQATLLRRLPPDIPFPPSLHSDTKT